MVFQENRDSSNPQSPRFLPAMLLLFVGSGFAALIYEIVWYQTMQLVIGLTTASLGVLLGTFMGGMCLGSYIMPRLIPRRLHPLRVYACLELGIGLIGVMLLYGFPYLADFYTSHFGYGFYGMTLRIIIAIIALLPPTVLMGATLPAVARYVESTPRGVSWMGFFYGGNIAGAVFGCLLAGFYLLRVHDVVTATYTAVAINVMVAVLGVVLANQATYSGSERASVMERVTQTVPRAPYAFMVYLAISLSGMSALGAEVIWTRLLGLVLGGTVYTFSIILAVFLAGLGFGSSVGSFLAREIRRPQLALGMCQLLLTLGIAWTAFMISNSLPYWPVNPSLSESPWYTFQIDMARTIWAVFPPTLLWGASFPLALAAVAVPGQDTGRLVGGVYAANTVGAIVGAIGFSLLFVPWLGSQDSQRILIVIAGISALVMFLPLLLPARSSPAISGQPAIVGRRFLGLSSAVATVALVLILTLSVQPAPWGIIAYGRYMATYVGQLVDGPNEPGSGGNRIWPIYQGEGLNGSVVVTENSNGIRSFHSAGKVQASNDPLDMKLQRMLGHISALAVEEPKSVLVVACGAGVTAGTFLLHPTIEEIYICDIEDLVPRYVAPIFDYENYGITTPYKDLDRTDRDFMLINGKKVYVINDDGRHFIRTAKRKFDIISSDPIDPWVKGCAALNTVEYYEMCKQHLNPDGVMSLWIPLYESKLETTKSVIGTFFTVFDKGIMWSNDDNGAGYDAVLFGQPEGSHFNIEDLEARLREAPQVMESLNVVGFRTAEDLLATFAAYAPDMQEWMNDPENPSQINHDRDMRLQYLAGWNLNTYESENILRDILRYRGFPEELFSGPPFRLQQLRARIIGRY